MICLKSLSINNKTNDTTTSTSDPSTENKVYVIEHQDFTIKNKSIMIHKAIQSNNCSERKIQ